MNPPTVVSRRDALKALGGGAAFLGLGPIAASGAADRAGRRNKSAKSGAAGTAQPFTLPKIGYGYDALEPHIDARTMEIHHTKHHQAYITNANNALKDQPELQKLTAEEMLRDLGALPEKVRTALRNNVGGHVNHAFFWQIIGPNAGGAPKGALNDAITQGFGSLDRFKAEFTSAAMSRFGSGWAWLVAKGGKLSVVSTANQDSPLTDGATPLLGLDVWEHAYYLKYQNRRADYVTAFWNVVNWSQVATNFSAAG